MNGSFKLTTLALSLAFLTSASAAWAAIDRGGSSSAGTAVEDATIPANNAFGYALAGDIVRDALSKDPNGNVLISPASAAMALQMLLNGAPTASTTYAELSKVLGLDKLDVDSVNKDNRSLIDYLQGLSQVPVPSDGQGPPPVPFTLSMSNSAWSNSRTGYQFKPAFVSTLQQNYDAVAKAVDFASSGAQEINQWASDETHGKITRIVDPKAIATMSFILMNATYFKANWSQQFQSLDNPPNARPVPVFINGDGTPAASSSMMEATLWGYTEVNGSEVMELPYQGGTASMYVVLPAQGRSLSDALADASGPLSASFWAQVNAATPERGQITMPKFKFSNDLELTQSLKNLGIQTLFGPAADLSAVGDTPTAVSSVKQNTYISVDEFGTEAAAVTSISAGSAIAPGSPLHEMVVNRPFLISIVEKTKGLVLFLGEVSSLQ